MILCRVSGAVVATQKNPELNGQRLLLVQPLDLRLAPKGVAMVALDRVDAGEGDLVLVNKEGGGARIILENQAIPVQAVVVGLVDNVDVDPALAKLPEQKA